MMDAALLAAAIAAAVALFGILMERRAERRAEQKKLFADALADVYRWVELPYRIRRRAPSSESQHSLATIISDLQERLDHHQSWIRIEDQRVHVAFLALLKKAKGEILPHLRASWAENPITDPAQMNLGELYSVDIATETDQYVWAVQQRLKWWRLWA